MKHTIVLAHRIPEFTDCNENVEIKLFILQIQHQKIDFNGAQYFTIDRSLCFEVNFNILIKSMEMDNKNLFLVWQLFSGLVMILAILLQFKVVPNTN